MDSSKIRNLLEQLDDELDDLEESLEPLIKSALSEASCKLPLLDKAKLYVLVTYAIETILFSYLRLNGINGRQHPVFTELTRVKQYFEKLQRAENPVKKRDNLNLDKGAASRMIKAGLAGNDKYDLDRAEQQAQERARAHIKFAELSEKMKLDEISKKRKAEELNVPETISESDSSPSEVENEPVISQESQKTSKKKRKAHSLRAQPESLPNSGVSSGSEKFSEKKHKKRKSKGTKKEK